MWRDSGLQVSFFGLDYRASIAVMFMVIYPTTWKTVVALAFLAFLYIAKSRGYSVDTLIRSIRVRLGGKRRPSPGRVGKWATRFRVHFGPRFG